MNLRTPAPKRLAILLLPVLLALAAATGAAGSGPTLNVPGQAAQGQLVGIAVAVRPAGVRCTLTVRYANGARQQGLRSQVARGGRAAWKWRVPENAAPGKAHAAVACGRAGRLDRTFVVVAKPKTAPKVVVAKQGFSLRYRPTGGSTASFGVILRNTSPDEDALKLQVLVNFVDSANVVVGSVSQPVGPIAAGSTYNYGGQLNWTGYANVARLEIVVTVGAHAPKAQSYPDLANVRIYPSPFDPGYVGEVDGELVNDHKPFTLGTAQLSVVLLDAAGNVVGGGSGSTFAPVPPGARMLFKVTSGFKAVKIDQAATALVSVVPTWRLGS